MHLRSFQSLVRTKNLDLCVIFAAVRSLNTIRDLELIQIQQLSTATVTVDPVDSILAFFLWERYFHHLRHTCTIAAGNGGANSIFFGLRGTPPEACIRTAETAIGDLNSLFCISKWSFYDRIGSLENRYVNTH